MPWALKEKFGEGSEKAIRTHAAAVVEAIAAQIDRIAHVFFTNRDTAILVSNPPPLICRLFAAAGEGLFSLIADPQNIDPRDHVAVSALAPAPKKLLHAGCEIVSQFNLDGLSPIPVLSRA